MNTKERPYEDFEIRILPELAGGDHLVYVTHSPVGEAMATMPRGFMNDPLLQSLEAVFQMRADRDLLQHIGSALFAALFREDVLLAFERSMDAVGRQRQLRIWLKIGSTQPKESYTRRGRGEYGLSDLPWELLYHTRTRQFLSLSPRMSLIRHVDYPYRLDEIRRADEGPLKVLVVLADPARYLNLSVEAEMIRRGLQSLGEGNVRLTVVETASRSKIQAALGWNSPLASSPTAYPPPSATGGTLRMTRPSCSAAACMPAWPRGCRWIKRPRWLAGRWPRSLIWAGVAPIGPA
ncbi:MAG: hypothetical protein QHJ81_05035 [Anaerolineae bacterium]|nr:hypothetical protein [Anaerolineae bacterium]